MERLTQSLALLTPLALLLSMWSSFGGLDRRFGVPLGRMRGGTAGLCGPGAEVDKGGRTG
ncbi:MAG TPA: hypothetical protein VFQ38_20100 [Longimicrobiales bacterium]|nr:hypothetical protein [Longimicrobiales bacterium]